MIKFVDLRLQLMSPYNHLHSKRRHLRSSFRIGPRKCLSIFTLFIDRPYRRIHFDSVMPMRAAILICCGTHRARGWISPSFYRLVHNLFLQYGYAPVYNGVRIIRTSIRKYWAHMARSSVSKGETPSNTDARKRPAESTEPLQNAANIHAQSCVPAQDGRLNTSRDRREAMLNARTADTERTDLRAYSYPRLLDGNTIIKPSLGVWIHLPLQVYAAMAYILGRIECCVMWLCPLPWALSEACTWETKPSSGRNETTFPTRTQRSGNIILH